MRLGSLVCGILFSIIYSMDFLYLQVSKVDREILYIIGERIECVRCFVSFVYQSIGEVPLLHATDNSSFTLYFLLN